MRAYCRQSYIKTNWIQCGKGGEMADFSKVVVLTGGGEAPLTVSEK
ncbi:MAG TPA: hypothetical protein VN611_14270 [Patescibacteria group bacterium]|nr:hypothetical protein [Patescibacteria group bacterium]